MFYRLFFILIFLIITANSSIAQNITKTGVYKFSGDMPTSFGGGYSKYSYEIDFKKEKFYIHIPKNYSESEQFGILVFMNPSNSIRSLPRGWNKVLREKKLIFISPLYAGNSQKTSRRVSLALASAYKLKEVTSIDTARIFISGFSGGGRIAANTSFAYPDLFSGVISICGINYYKKVPRIKATEKGSYGYCSVKKSKAEETINNVSYCIITGPKDFRYGNLLDIYNGGFKKDDHDVKLIVVKGMGHSLCSGKILDEALSFVEG